MFTVERVAFGAHKRNNYMILRVGEGMVDWHARDEPSSQNGECGVRRKARQNDGFMYMYSSTYRCICIGPHLVWIMQHIIYSKYIVVLQSSCINESRVF